MSTGGREFPLSLCGGRRASESGRFLPRSRIGLSVEKDKGSQILSGVPTDGSRVREPIVLPI